MEWFRCGWDSSAGQSEHAQGTAVFVDHRQGIDVAVAHHVPWLRPWWPTVR